jgi:hypothetical protein
MWVKSYFVIRHPRSVIQHESSMVLRSLFSTSPFKTKVIITAYNNHFALSIAGQGKLLFFSVFDFQNAEDILYNLMFTLQQKELLEKEGELIWCNGTGAKAELLDAFSEIKSKVKNLDHFTLMNDPNLILNSHKLCV